MIVLYDMKNYALVIPVILVSLLAGCGATVVNHPKPVHSTLTVTPSPTYDMTTAAKTYRSDTYTLDNKMLALVKVVNAQTTSTPWPQQRAVMQQIVTVMSNYITEMKALEPEVIPSIRTDLESLVSKEEVFLSYYVAMTKAPNGTQGFAILNQMKAHHDGLTAMTNKVWADFSAY